MCVNVLLACCSYDKIPPPPPQQKVYFGPQFQVMVHYSRKVKESETTVTLRPRQEQRDVNMCVSTAQPTLLLTQLRTQSQGVMLPTVTGPS